MANLRATFMVTYEFEFQCGGKFVYSLELDQETVSLISDRKSPSPHWTRLEHNQCTVCPLKKEDAPYCPIAQNIADLTESFKDIDSYEYVRIVVRTAERNYEKEGAAQKGLASIFGIIMATSNCPIMDFLKPMARYHLPFSTHEETIVRSVSMYLLGQFVMAKRSGTTHLSLEKLDQAYSLVQKVNQGLCQRISSVVREGKRLGDAANNAIVILDIFSQLLKLEMEGQLESLKTLFKGIPFFDPSTFPQKI